MVSASLLRLQAVTFAVAVLLAAPARAAGSSTCDDAFSTAPALIKAGHFLAARGALLRCSADGCPAAMRSLCVADLRDFETRVPSVVFVAKSADGGDVLDVRVVERGVVLAERIDGRAVDLDPGPHTFRFERSAASPVLVDVLVREGERARLVTAELSPSNPLTPGPAPVSPVTPTPAVFAPVEASARRWRTVGLVTAGVGVVAVGLGTYFGFDAISKNNTSNHTGCNGDACSGAGYTTREDARTAATASTVLLVVGGALAAGGLSLWLLAPKPGAGDTARVMALSPVPLMGGFGAALEGRWH